MKLRTDFSVAYNTSKIEIIKQIQQLVPPRAPEPQERIILAKLQKLTADLIKAYQVQGGLQADPFTDVQNRTIYLYQSKVKKQLRGSVVLVTGGEGYVGSHLIRTLIELGVQKVISVDKVRCCNFSEMKPTGEQKASVRLYASDVRNYAALEHIFNAEKPDVVFHLAAQRSPGLAEIQIRETVTTSILGTQNIIQLCEKYGVKQCIFASTGKASRYFTSEVYAASKKFSEWQFAQAASEGHVTYGMVRFTHMLGNSLVCQQIDDKIKQNRIVNVHAPERYVTAQNVGEAVHLLLNALVLSQPGKLKFLTVRNLGWPTETLEVALYKILKSGKQLPIYFQGLLPGYEEKFFLGQFDWSKPTEINLLLNALETQTVDQSGDMLVAELAAFSAFVQNKYFTVLQTLLDDPELPEPQIKQYLCKAVRKIASSVFYQTHPQQLLQILKWGLNPKQMVDEETSVHDYQEVVELLVGGLYGRLDKKVLLNAQVTPNKFDELLEIISTLPSIQEEVAYLKLVSRKVREFN